jgi:hypothetical protein
MTGVQLGNDTTVLVPAASELTDCVWLYPPGAIVIATEKLSVELPKFLTDTAGA